MDEDYVSVEAAGRTVGVSPRTVREWILQGKLSAFGSRRGKVVRLADVVAIAGTAEYHPASVQSPDEDKALVAAPPAEQSGIEGILEELRDGVLWPLAERVELLARENGRLAAERDAAVARAAADLAFVERLVALLQEQLAAANQRIAQLEAQLAEITARHAEELANSSVSQRIGRRRLGQGAPGAPVPLPPAAPPEPAAIPPAETAEPEPKRGRRWPWWRR
jgi:hypothetical protein